MVIAASQRDIENSTTNLCAWVVPTEGCVHLAPPPSEGKRVGNIHSPLLLRPSCWMLLAPGQGKLTWQPAGISALPCSLLWVMLRKWGWGQSIGERSQFFFPLFLPPWDNHWFLLVRNARDTRTCRLMHMKGQFLFHWPWRLAVTTQDKHS